MNIHSLFRDAGVSREELVAFVKSIEICCKLHGRDSCWSIDRAHHAAFSGFNTANPKNLRYCGVDARPLILSISGQFQPDESHVAIRKSICKSQYCLNPAHYYWGTKSEVALEGQRKKKDGLTPDVIRALQEGRREGKRVLDLARKYKVAYHTARRICAGETYETQNKTRESVPDQELWALVDAICKELISRYPEEAREYRLGVYVANELECPWHQRGEPGHKGNFGLMGECLDCMEEVRKGRCSVDVTNFDMQWYWQVKRFWEQVEIRGEDECWPWNGATRRNGNESLAYFPSPFHSGKTQSASRVAFWLSRGYTGKYKVFTKPECESFCCNPRHLHIREFKDMLDPAKIGEIRLNHGDIFAHHRKNLPEKQPGVSQQSPPA